MRVPTSAVSLVVLASLTSGVFGAQFTFSNKNYSVADAPQGMASGDLDGDTYADFIVTASNPDRVEWWLNDATGKFNLGGTLLLPAGSAPGKIALADLDGDLLLDAAVLLTATGEMQLATGLGDGSFVLGTTLAAGLNPADIRAADADGDLDMDLLVSTQGDDTATLFFNDGAGVMTGLAFAVGVSPHGVTFGDFDGDLDLDFAVANTVDQSISVFENLGQGLFGAWSTIQGDNDFYGIDSSDLDGDQDDDLAVAGADFLFDNFATVFLSDGLGGWGPQVDYSMPAKGAKEIVIADLDCDGDDDLALGLTSLNTPGIIVYENDGSGDFPVSQRRNYGAEVTDIVTDDFDHDGGADLAHTAADSDVVQVSLNKTCGLEIFRDGLCDEMNDFVFSGATPGGLIVVLIANDTGTFVLPPQTPNCAGTVVGLDGASIMIGGFQIADVNGEFAGSFWGGMASCGQWMQIIDVETCNVSNLSQLHL
ncbi:MAG: FG-GAP-like repeat-containing protein [Planctomycetota bacterium]|jgi:hypothetical protein